MQGIDSCLQCSSLTVVMKAEMPMPSKTQILEGVFWEPEVFIW